MNALNGKVVIITGGGRGIGAALARRIAHNGARVALVARTQDELERTKAEIEGNVKGAEILALPSDVSDAESFRSAVGRVESEWSAPFGLICAAGVATPIGPFETLDFNAWKKTIEINLIGSALAAHTVIPSMKKAGSGRIILFSGGGQGALANLSAYVTSKGGIWRFTETLAAELKEHGIYVNSIAPGAVNTKITEDFLNAGADRIGKSFHEATQKQKESGGQSPEKAAELALYLLSDRSKGLTGKTLSAIWDPYEDFKDLEKLSNTDIFTVRRVMNDQGGTRAMRILGVALGLVLIVSCRTDSGSARHGRPSDSAELALCRD